ncbi:MAG: hypothetical protein ACFB3T_11505 [Geminicoccaceae bacterium]
MTPKHMLPVLVGLGLVAAGCTTRTQADYEAEAQAIIEESRAAAPAIKPLDDADVDIVNDPPYDPDAAAKAREAYGDDPLRLGEPAPDRLPRRTHLDRASTDLGVDAPPPPARLEAPERPPRYSAGIGVNDPWQGRPGPWGKDPRYSQYGYRGP